MSRILREEVQAQSTPARPPAPTTPPSGPWWMGWVLAGVSLAVATACAELALHVAPLPLVKRLQARQAAGAGLGEEVHPRGLYTLHPAIGWTLTPHFSGRFRKDDFDISVTANAQGLRDRDYGPKLPDTYRILGLGDSFAFGWGVENAQSFYKVLETRLNQVQTVRHIEVINAGIPGFGTYEASQLLKTVGLGYGPDLVILAFYEGNDYQNTGEAPRDRVIDDGYLRDAPRYRRFGAARWLIAHSVLAAMLDTQMDHIAKKRSFKADVAKVMRLLQEMRAVLEPRHVPLVVVLIPDQEAAFYERPVWFRRYDRLMSGMDLFEARRVLDAFCRAQGIWFCQLSPRFEHHPESPQLRLRDTHFNARGHAAAAEEIDRFLHHTVLRETQ